MTDRQSDSIDSVMSRWPWWRMFPRKSPLPEPRLRTLPLDPLPPRADADPEREAWGICLSGGGIRSAAYSLGVLQEMEEHEMLSGPRRAWYLSAVSGGSYIGGAFTMIARGAYPDEAEGSTQTICPVDPPAFGRGSPEEIYVREHLQYLSRGPGGAAAALWRFVLGICLNLLFIGLLLHALVYPVGWLYGWRVPNLRYTLTDHQYFRIAQCSSPHAVAEKCLEPRLASLSLPGPFWTVFWAIAALAFLSGLLWIGVRWNTYRRAAARLGQLSGVLVALVVAGFITLIAIPHTLEFVRVDLPRHGIGTEVECRPIATPGATPSRTTLAPTTGFAAPVNAVLSGRSNRVRKCPNGYSPKRIHLAGLPGVGWGALASLALTGLTAGAAVRSTNATPPLVRNAEKAVERVAVSRGKRLAARFRGPLLNLSAAILVPFLVLGTSLFWINIASLSPPLTPGISTVSQLLWWAVPAMLLAALWWRGDATNWSLHPFYKERLASTFSLRRFRTSAPADGQGAEPRSYEQWYPLSQSQAPDSPELLICAAANLTEYGATPSGSNATSFVLSAREIGGPEVGYLSTDIYEQVAADRGRDLTLPTAVAIASAAFSPAMGKMTRRPLRALLALLNLRLGVWLPNPRKLVDTGKYPPRPRPDCLLREIVGRNTLQGGYIYVTDGGHYENLGLVELLRRRCRWIWCVDASGDAIDTFNTIGQAVAIARSELEVDIAIDPERDMAPDTRGSEARAKVGKPPFVQSVFCRGTIDYHDGHDGELVVLKAGVPKDAPWDVQSFYERHAQFPCDPTFNQSFTAEHFDAYRALGYFAMQCAWKRHGRDFEAFRGAP